MIRKITFMTVAIAALLAFAAAPAFAKISDVSSGAARPVIQVSNTGDNANICVPAQQIVNTGNVANEQSVDQISGSFIPDASEVARLHDLGFDNADIQDLLLSGNLDDGSGDVDLTGSTLDVSGTLDASCDQSIVL